MSGSKQKILTRADLAKAIYHQMGLSHVEAKALLEDVLDTILESLRRGESVKISSFGSFYVRSKTSRIGRNPKTGEEVPISPRNVLSFRFSQKLKSRISAPRS